MAEPASSFGRSFPTWDNLSVGAGAATAPHVGFSFHSPAQEWKTPAPVAPIAMDITGHHPGTPVSITPLSKRRGLLKFPSPAVATKIPSGADRYIPSRVTDFRWSLEGHAAVEDAAETPHNDALSRACLGVSLDEAQGQTVLPIAGGSAKASEPPPQEIGKFMEQIAKAYPPKPNRSFSYPLTDKPDRVLDAPGMIDDYYVNVLDWSKGGVLAVALGRRVWLRLSDDTVRALAVYPEGSRVSSVRWLQDGYRLVVGVGKSVDIYDTASGRQSRHFSEHATKRINALAESRGQLFTGAHDGAIRMMDLREMGTPKVVQMDSSRYAICNLSINGDRIASGADDATAHLHDLRRSSKAVWEQEFEAAVKVAFNKHGKLAVGTGSTDRRVCLLSADTGNIVKEFQMDRQVGTLAWCGTEEDKLAVVLGKQNELVEPPSSVMLLDDQLKVRRALEVRYARGLQIAVHSTGSHIVTAGPEALCFYQVDRDRKIPNKQKTIVTPGFASNMMIR